MAISPKDDILAREIESWNGFAEGLRAEDKKIFQQMLRQCYKHAGAIHRKGEVLPAESILMSLLLSQQRLIEFLLVKTKR
jgi:hypothetical protein